MVVVLVLLMGLLLGGAPAGAVSAGAAGAQGGTAGTAPGGTGGTAGNVAVAVAGLDDLVAGVMRRTGVPGVAVAVVSRGEVVALRGYGVRELGRPEAVDADTVFQIASLSKPIASTVVAALVGDGVVTWDDRLIDHLPEFALSDPWISSEVTLRDLFSHRSGLRDHGGDLLEDIGYDRATVLQRLRYLAPEYSFRAGYAYTNFGLTAAGEGAARAAGRSWEDLSAERLYRPLGMASTSSRHADYLAAPNRARLHAQIDGAFVARYDRDPDPQSPAGGVSSTGRDMARWLTLQLGGGMIDGRRVVGAGPLDETHRPTSTLNYNPQSGAISFYGLGWNVRYDDAGRRRLSHSGAFGLGAATAVSAIPAEQVGIVVLTNGAPVGAAEAISESFMEVALTGRLERDYLALFGPFFDALAASPYGKAADYQTPLAQAAPALPLAAYVGDLRQQLRRTGGGDRRPRRPGPAPGAGADALPHVALGPGRVPLPAGRRERLRAQRRHLLRRAGPGGAADGDRDPGRRGRRRGDADPGGARCPPLTPARRSARSCAATARWRG